MLGRILRRPTCELTLRMMLLDRISSTASVCAYMGGCSGGSVVIELECWGMHVSTALACVPSLHALQRLYSMKTQGMFEMCCMLLMLRPLRQMRCLPLEPLVVNIWLTWEAVLCL